MDCISACIAQIRIRGEAEAFAISAKAKAEAEQMAKKAEAWREYREAAMVDMLLDTLPKVCTSFPFYCRVHRNLSRRLMVVFIAKFNLTGCC